MRHSMSHRITCPTSRAQQVGSAPKIESGDPFADERLKTPVISPYGPVVDQIPAT